MPEGVVTRVLEGPAGERWDSFLAKASGGHPSQTSGWMRLKQQFGWSVFHVLAEDDVGIRGGGHLLWKKVGPFGAVGYVPKGPVVDPDSVSVISEIVGAFQDGADQRRIRILAVQPPVGGSETERILESTGWTTGLGDVSLPATVRVDVRATDDELLARMRRSTRTNIRKNKGDLLVRFGSRDDVGLLHSLMAATGGRQAFEPESAGYLSAMWDALGHSAEVAIILTEAHGDPVSALLAVALGDTAYFKRGGWTGLHGDLRPNEAMHWAAIRWARDSGRSWYDLEGIHMDAASAALSGEPLPDNLMNSNSRFKLGFGGLPTIDPATFVRVNPRVVRRALGVASRSKRSSRLLSRAIRRLRAS